MNNKQNSSDRPSAFTFSTLQSTADDTSFKVQINSFDSYQNTPTNFDRSSPPNNEDIPYYHVPTIRVFGSIPTGNKILVHIHGIFPYIYVPHFDMDCWKLQELIERKVANSLQQEDDNNKEKEITQFKYIAHVSVCKGVPFYGYHVGYQKFFKVHLLNPSYKKRVAGLFSEGVISGFTMSVFEAHIPFGLQFMKDYNLFGCGWLKCNEVFIRTPIVLDWDLKTDELTEYMMGHRTTNLERVGTSALEIDILAQNIANREDLKEKDIHYDFVERMNRFQEKETYIQSTKDLWRDGEFQRRLKSKPSYSPPDSIKRKYKENSWVESKENKSIFDYIKNLNINLSKELDFESFITNKDRFPSVPTTFSCSTELFYTPDFNQPASQPFKEAESQQEEDGEEDYVHENEYEDNMNHQIGEPYKRDEEEEEGDIYPNFFEDDNLNKGLSETSNIADISDIQMTQDFANKFTKKKRLFSQAFKFDRTISSIGSSPPIDEENLVRIPLLIAGTSKFDYDIIPPSREELEDFEDYGLPKVDYNDPFYMEKPPSKPFISGNRMFKLESKLLSDLPELSLDEDDKTEIGPRISRNTRFSEFKNWRYMKEPPSFQEVDEYTSINTKVTQSALSQHYKFISQATNERRPDGFNNLTVLIVEVFVRTRENFKPDPTNDEIVAIIWRFMDGSNETYGCFINEKKPFRKPTSIEKTFSFNSDELAMLEVFAKFTLNLDPDILAGYEVHASSWGYIIDRCRAAFRFDMMNEISRVTFKSHCKMGDHWGQTHASSIKICGRHVINIWRPLKELKLGKTTIEHAAFHLLHVRISYLSEKSLTELYEVDMFQVLDYFMERCDINARLIEKAELVVQAAEEARLIGIDFFDVYYRGSQFKVESLMTRIAKTENFLLLSPTKRQVRNQKPLECIPLVMEPASAYYKSPLIVLDFQSLYPSIIIAYNYCYSTLLGRLRNYSEKLANPIGTARVRHPQGLLKLLENDINLSPNGLMFVQSSVRKSLLAKMLEDLLDTRQMVKDTMKFLDDNMKQLYNNRQLALKLTANVTYGYTSASFSGRMPCSDIADAIVQTGRETLEKAVELIEEEAKWGAKVVYGDTDSLFVYLPGKYKEEAFKIGKEMAEYITSKNPNPITLKFEKVYHPSILMAKKRYVGYSYESSDQEEPKFDAKGIETVRRDGHPAQQYIVEKSLRKLFETQNISEIKSFVIDQFQRILNNNISIQNFCFARAVKMGTYKNPPPGAMVSAKKMEQDSRAEPQYKERVPYLIVEKPGANLRDRAVSPEDFIKNNCKLDGHYYIVKTLIPPLQRIFNLLGVDISPWYTDLPAKGKRAGTTSTELSNGTFKEQLCLNCGRKNIKGNLCHFCKRNELQTILNFRSRFKITEAKLYDLRIICHGCSGDKSRLCESEDCPIYYTKVRERGKLRKLIQERNDLKGVLDW